MKKKLALLFVMIMVLSCMPAMNAAPGKGFAVTAEAATNGWKKSGSTYKYYMNGRAYKSGIYNIGGKLYGFNAKGLMQVKWFKLGANKYYASTQVGAKGKGAILTGYRKVGGSYYYLDPAKNGAAYSGFMTIKGKLMYFDDEGAQKREPGWFNVGNASYYILADGSIATNTKIGGYTIPANGAVYGIRSAMDKKAQGYSSNTRWLILVNKKQHKIGLYTGSKGNWTLVRGNMPCTIGKSSTPSPSGSFRLSSKSKGAYGYKDFKASTAFYASRISAGNYFHSILFKKGARNPYTAKVRDGSLGKNKSNSCIRLKVVDAKLIYEKAPRLSRVIVY